MKKLVYYNEYNAFAAKWLRNLIKAGHIAPGDVDERPIQEVQADDIKGYKQCHFFAGIGGWSLALRLAGWPDDRPVWTGSCPCQPFSSAGRQKGKADDRHLWPVWLRLIEECRPPVLYGEQVASAVAHGWLDDVYQGLEAQGYAVGAAVLPASAVGKAHRRERLWFVGNTSSERTYGQQKGEPLCRNGLQPSELHGIPAPSGIDVAGNHCGVRGAMGNTQHDGSHGAAQLRSDEADGTEWWAKGAHLSGESSGTSRPSNVRGVQGSNGGERENPSNVAEAGVWLDCPDGKQRLIEPSIPLLVDGVPSVRVAGSVSEYNHKGALEGFGNAIVPQVAAEFIKASL